MKSKLNIIELNLYFGRPKSLKQAKKSEYAFFLSYKSKILKSFYSIYLYIIRYISVFLYTN